MQLGHRALELAGRRGRKHERAGTQLPRVLGVLGDEDVEQPLRGVREPPRAVFAEVVPRPLPAARERVEGRKEVERDQERPPLQELAVVHLTPGGQRVLQLPRDADAVVMM